MKDSCFMENFKQDKSKRVDDNPCKAKQLKACIHCN